MSITFSQPSLVSSVTGSPVYNTYLIVVSNGVVYIGTPSLSPTPAANQGSAPLSANVPVSSARIFNEVYFVDGTHIADLDLPTLSMVTYKTTAGATPNSTTAQVSLSVSSATATGATPAVVTITTSTVHGQSVGQSVFISGASPSGYNGTWVITSVPSTTTFTYTAATALTSPATGTILALVPYTGPLTTCSIACSWRGRLVLAGDSGSPQNFYMSRAGVPTDWNYGATDSAAAFAGNLSTSGLIGEPITALIPFTDDIMIVGCTHSIWMLQGDPTDGGTIVPISQNIGIIGPNAWCKDSFDTLYFIGTNGLYKGCPLWEQWQPPQLLTGDNYHQYFQNLASSSKYFTLVWNEVQQYINLFATPADDTTIGTHLVFDVRGSGGEEENKSAGGIWPIQYGLATGPTAAIEWYSDGSPANRGVLLGGWDGVLRRQDLTALDDTGDPITASLTFGPFHPFPEAALLTGTTIDFGEVLLTQAGNSPVSVVGETPSGVIDGSNTSFNLANSPVITDSVALTVNGVYLAQNQDYTIDINGDITVQVGALVPPGAIFLASYFYQVSSPNPWNVLVTLNSGPDAFNVTEEGQPHTTLNIDCVLERRQKTFRQRLRGGWFSVIISNNQLDTYFSFESALLEFHDAGRNRERR